ncbi:MAG TPA: thioredoxin domain-containing protein [Polyangiaceae bacterium]
MRYLAWLLAFVCAACAAPRSQPAPSAPKAAVASAGAPASPLLPVYADDLMWGASDPLVTIVAFLDFAKEDSRTRYAALAELVEQSPELRLVVKQAPLELDGEPIAESTLAVRDTLGSKAAKEFLGMVSDASGAPSKEELSVWALGLTATHGAETAGTSAVRRDTRQQLQRNLELARRLELLDTPVLYVNGVRWQPGGDDDDQRFSSVLAEELRASKAERPQSATSELHYARRVEANWASRETAPTAARGAVSPLADAPEPSWGSPSAPVTLVEFTDFECPFCSRVQPTLAQLRKKYGPKQLRMVFKHNPLPFHKSARPAAEAAVIVFQKGGDRAFWAFHDRVFENQKELTPGNFERWAAEAGVSSTDLRHGLDRGRASAKVQADMALAAKVGVSGTPAFRINGVTLSGAQPVDKFVEVIDQQLELAAELRRQGVSSADVSALLTERQLTLGDTAPKAPGTVPSEDSTAWRVPVSPDDPVDGPSDALVTLIEFANLQCPFCKRVQPTLKALRAKYGADLRIVWKDNPLPFHPRAKPAATVARSIYERRGVRAFWQAVDAIFDSQPKLEDDDLKRLVEAQSGSWQHALAALKSDRFASKIEESQELATDFQARGTPYFFINGVRLSGAQPQEKFEELIEAELRRAKALVAKGLPRAKVFETLMADAAEPPPPEKKQVAAPVGSAPYRGPANAKVVIQIFSDFQCPFCLRVNATLDALLKAQPRIKLVWRNLPLPFHKDADLAAQAAHEVFLQLGNQGFWKYHKLLFEAQQQTDGLKRPNLETLAQKLGANMVRFRAALDAEKHRARIESDKTAAQTAGISGTPGFVIGDYYLSGAQPLAHFEKLVRRVQAGR